MKSGNHTICRRWLFYVVTRPPQKLVSPRNHHGIRLSCLGVPPSSFILGCAGFCRIRRWSFSLLCTVLLRTVTTGESLPPLWVIKSHQISFIKQSVIGPCIISSFCAITDNLNFLSHQSVGFQQWLISFLPFRHPGWPKFHIVLYNLSSLTNILPGGPMGRLRYTPNRFDVAPTHLFY